MLLREPVTDKITRVTEKGIASTDGQERAFDVIVLATGFQTTKFFSAIPVTGKNGQSLTDVWSGGAQAYLGITVPGGKTLGGEGNVKLRFVDTYMAAAADGTL